MITLHPAYYFIKLLNIDYSATFINVSLLHSYIFFLIPEFILNLFKLKNVSGTAL
jgi:hypothetical protein